MNRIFQRFLATKKDFSAICVSTSDVKSLLHLAYLAILQRPADPAGLTCYTNALRNGMSISDFIGILISTPEYQATWVPDPEAPISILGSESVLSRRIWNERARSVKFGRTLEQTPVSAGPGPTTVSIITSLYKGGRFIEQFLENMISQTYFDRTELIIVDAASPDDEYKTIERYLKRYENIIYERLDRRIGIYEAWNHAISMSRGAFLTNANVDDLRAVDGIESQVREITASGADIVYQNVYYSLDPHMSFDQVASMGFVSNLPDINAGNLLQFNSPHNAPLWRKSIHSDAGVFDETFTSAGDWEFWIRCLTKGKKFHRINRPLATYYVNPDGISTSPSSKGLAEGKIIIHKYKHLLFGD
jgi:hypothetical protein